MITFCIAIVLLLLGYFVYSKIIERIVEVDPQRQTPAVVHSDGVDFVPMKPWRIYLIQFLNIAGVGPICGAIMGAQFGTASFLWIVFGSIFAGAVHDFISGFISIRMDGASLPDIHGASLGRRKEQFMRLFTIVLMVLVGAVFVNTPAVLLHSNFTPSWNIFIWVGIIFAYYLIATLLPIDKVIGKIYPIFGILLLAMAVAIVVAFVVYKPAIPEVWDGLQNRHPDAAHNPIFPMMFISIACGAISGFHATQSPLMARCMTNEKQARPIFYGAMITEGLVALIWATVGLTLREELAGLSPGLSISASCKIMLGEYGGVIAMLGVVVLAITSGDTALRMGRLILADMLHMDQTRIWKRLALSAPLFLVVIVFFNTDFSVLWRYFGLANQVLACMSLWMLSLMLRQRLRVHEAVCHRANGVVCRVPDKRPRRAVAHEL